MDSSDIVCVIICTVSYRGTCSDHAFHMGQGVVVSFRANGCTWKLKMYNVCIDMKANFASTCQSYANKGTTARACVAYFSKMETEKLHQIGRDIGLTGTDLAQFIKEGIQYEREKETAAREERKEERAWKQAELKAQEAKVQAEVRREEIKLRQMELKKESGKDKSSESEHNVKVRYPKLPVVNEKTDDIDAYLQRFERFATSAGWPEDIWAISLASLLQGRALDIYHQLSQTDAGNYSELKSALLRGFDCTAEGFRVKFRRCRFSRGETAKQLIARMTKLCERWIEMENCSSNYNSLKDLMIREQFISCDRNLKLFLKECSLATLQDLEESADRYIEAHGHFTLRTPQQAPVSSQSSAQQFGQVNEGSDRSPCKALSSLLPQVKCYISQKGGHKAWDCYFRPNINQSKVASTSATSAPTRKEAGCIPNPIHDLVIGNVPGVRLGDNYGKHTCGVMTRDRQMKERKQPELKVLAVSNMLNMTIKRAQQEDKTLDGVRKYAEEGKDFFRRKKNEFSMFILKRGVLYRKVKIGDLEREQLLVPSQCRSAVLDLAHSSIMWGHLATGKTKDRVMEKFFWPGITKDIERYCRSCDVCQRTVDKGKVQRAKLGKLPIIGEPFSRLAVDIVGSIEPRSSDGSRYILTVVDFATRYPEGVALQNIDTASVAEALVNIFSRVGIPREVLSDRGTQFTSAMMQEVYREVPQASTKFSPFELVYGHTVRGPMTLLRELFDGEVKEPETRSSYEYVISLRERLEDTCRMALNELKNAQEVAQYYYDRKTKDRVIESGDYVLLLLPTNSNKLLFQWKGPFKVIGSPNRLNKIVDVNGTLRKYHIDMLKRYVHRESADAFPAAVVVVNDEDNAEGRATTIPSYNQSETWRDVSLDSDLPADQRDDAKGILQAFGDVLTDVPGKTTDIEYNIELTVPETIRVKPYPLPYRLEEEVKKELRSMLEIGITEPSDSEYSTPILVVPKKDGNRRLCLDFRKLNKITKFDAEPMCDTEAIFCKIGRSRYFSKIYLTKGYWQIRLTKESRKFTAFSTPAGLFQFTVLPFGLVNAPAVFNRLMIHLFGDMDGVETFLDDILIHSKTWKQHCSILQKVLGILRETNLTARPVKCEKGKRSLEYLGHMIGEGHIKPTKEKVSAILNAPAPTTKKEVRSFMGLSGYYRRFVPDYATIAAPLNDLVKKNAPNRVKWEDKHEMAFNKLKQVLVNNPILKLPDVNKSFILRTDASDVGLGAVLLQEDADVKMPVAYASRKLSDAEKKYLVERECLAVQFYLETDHRPITYLDSVKTLNGRLMRWAIALQEFRMIFSYIKGSENVGADYLMNVCDVAEVTSEKWRIPWPHPRYHLHAGVTSRGSRPKDSPATTRDLVRCVCGNRLGRQSGMTVILKDINKENVNLRCFISIPAKIATYHASYSRLI
ncbi:uncharacterized protein [Penaeus vannamei]|uniref:uncharacterized protein n=1 Tax=Penaeus vannamei TaxID=6689 RepID=UPI00387F7FF5